MTVENPTPAQHTGGVLTPGLELQLMTSLAELRADMAHVRKTGDDTNSKVDGLTTRVSKLEVDVSALNARSNEPDPEVMSRLAVAETKLAAQTTINQTLQAALDSRALTWPKLLTGLAAIVGAIVALGLYTPGA